MDNGVLIIGELLIFSGHILIAWAAIAVHHRVRHERKIDKKVFQVMRREGYLGYIGIALLSLGFLIKFIDYF